MEAHAVLLRVVSKCMGRFVHRSITFAYQPEVRASWPSTDMAMYAQAGLLKLSSESLARGYQVPGGLGATSLQQQWKKER